MVKMINSVLCIFITIFKKIFEVNRITCPPMNPSQTRRMLRLGLAHASPDYVGKSVHRLKQNSVALKKGKWALGQATNSVLTITVTQKKKKKLTLLSICQSPLHP